MFYKEFAGIFECFINVFLYYIIHTDNEYVEFGVNVQKKKKKHLHPEPYNVLLNNTSCQHSCSSNGKVVNRSTN